MDLITIIVPVYNAELTLEKCVASILSQTYKNWELVLVDDGSTDRSAGICDLFCEKDKRIKAIHKQNGGVSSARNAGLKNAEGNYIGFVDADDYIADNFIEVLYENAFYKDCDISFCDYYEDREGYLKECKAQIKENSVLSQREFICEVAGGNIQGFLCNKLFKKEILYDKKGNMLLLSENIYICEDLLYLVQIAGNAKQFGYAAVSLYYYCQRPGSAYNSPYHEKKLTEIQAYDRIYRILSEKAPEGLPALEKKYLNMALKLQDVFVRSAKGTREEKETIRQAIQKYEICVMNNPEVFILEKVYYKIYKWFPKGVRSLKNRKHQIDFWILRKQKAGFRGNIQ